jgi:HEAT repeat protein
MAIEKDFKRLVRQRAAETGERYTEARAALRAEAPPVSPQARRPSTVEQWVELLDDVEQAHGAFAQLKALAPEQLRPLALAGLTHESWRVRRRCARLLDDLAFTDESLAALEACLDDPHPKVRGAAMHTLSCAHCKPDGCALDRRAIFERMRTDPSAKVRSRIVNPLSWQLLEPWSIDLLERIVAEDPSPQLRASAARALANHEANQASNDAHKALPEELRRKTERHRGKWVAIAKARIIGIGEFEGALRRIIRGHGHEGRAATYWVGPE